jgi:hypothetical protein
MDVTLCVRPGDGGIIVAVSGEVDVSGVSFMDCAGLRALLATRRRAELRGGFMRLIAVSRAVRRIMELTGTHEALAAEREPRTVRSNSSFTERTGCDAPTEPYGRTAGKQP